MTEKWTAYLAPQLVAQWCGTRQSPEVQRLKALLLAEQAVAKAASHAPSESERQELGTIEIRLREILKGR